MGSLRRRNRWIVISSCAVFLAIALAPFIVRNAATLAVLLVALTVVLCGLMITRLLSQARDTTWRRDAWLVRNAQPRLNAALLIGSLLAAGLAFALGIAFVYLGYAIGWSLIVVSTGWVVVIAITRWLSRQPVDGESGADRPERN